MASIASLALSRNCSPRQTGRDYRRIGNFDRRRGAKSKANWSPDPGKQSFSRYGALPQRTPQPAIALSMP